MTSHPLNIVNSLVLLFTSSVAVFPRSLSEEGKIALGMEKEAAARGFVQPLKLCSFSVKHSHYVIS